MKALPNRVYASFFKLSEKNLQGDWVVLGGALLHLLGRHVRTTTDIDLVPLLRDGGKTANAQLAQSFDLAESLQVPIESINSAALHFLKKIPRFEKELVLMHTWKTGRMFRPNLYLYFQLKLARLSESDELDCVEILKLELPEATEPELKRILKEMRSLKKKSKNDQFARIGRLIEAVREQIARMDEE